MNPISVLIHELSKLPSIGEKSAMRLALHILREPPEYGLKLAKALQDTVSQVRFCENCLNITTTQLCSICENKARDQSIVCVIEEIADLQAIESTHSFKGHYHCLHGSLSPIDGIGPAELRIAELEKRLKENTTINEIILATNPNVNGDATALYLSKMIRPYQKKITRLASGIPIGGHIEFIDQNTITRALNNRIDF